MNHLEIRAESLPYRYALELAGAGCELMTNDQQLGATLDRWAARDCRECRLRMYVLVSGDDEGAREAGNFRGMHHVVVASFGRANVFVFDLLRQTIAANVSEPMARDLEFWNEVLLPIMMGVMGATVGVVPIHCACLSIENDGLLVAGASGAGKSTLAAALAQAGFDYVSDDWTYVRGDTDGLLAHGLASRVKLLPDAITHFPALSQHSVGVSMNGELAYEVPASAVGATIRRVSAPRWGIFLERTADFAGSELVPTSRLQARQYLESSVERLPTQLDGTVRDRALLMDGIASLPWWTFRYGGSPQFAARELRTFVARQRQEEAA